MKPSNDTQKSTKCWTGGSSSSPTCQPGRNADSSKRYGNGTTAAQIAVSRGASANTEIYGPGNSQPHKVCKKVNKNGKEVWVDVHAVKTYVWINCSTAPTEHSQNAATHTSSTDTNHASSTHVTSPTSHPGSTSGTAAVGGVAGVAAESGSPQAGSNGAAGGVLGAFGVAGASGTLPFTGLPLSLAILLAIGLIATGWTLRRHGRSATGELV